MFLSYEYLGPVGFDKETNQHKYRYKIVDTDFEEIITVGEIEDYIDIDGAVIDTYEKRNLNVAANLALSFVWYANKFHATAIASINQIIEWNKKYNSKFKKYEQDINKYLTLL